MTNILTKTHRMHLLGTASAMALIITAGSAFAQEVDATTGDFALGINQTLNGFQASTITVESTVDGDITTTENEAAAVEQSTLDVGSTEGNVISSSLTGNLSSSVLTSDTNNDFIGLASSDMTAGVVLDAGRLRAVAGSEDANLAVNTVQNVNETEASVNNTSTIGSFTSDVTESSVNVVNNTQEGVGILNRNSSTIDATANATEASVGISTSQNVTPSTGVNPVLNVATNALTGISAAAATTLDGDVTETTLDLSGNSQTAVAAANVGSNTINANATDITVFAAPATTTIDLTTPDSGANAVAGYAIASSQVVDMLGDGNQMLATVDGSTAGFEIDIDGIVESSTLANNNNNASALLIGNEVANTASLAGNSIVTIDEVTDEPVPGAAAAISSLQIFNANATATAMADAGQAVRTIVGDTVTDSTLTTSSNTVEATAIGNTGANHVNAGVSGGANAINTTGSGTGAPATANAIGGLAGTVSTTGAGFELSSAQTSSGSITATLQSDDGLTSASIATEIGDDISSSTVASNGNTLSATATANEITTQTNEIEVTGNTVSTTTALANFQATDADVSAVVGAPGTPAVAPQTFTLPSGTTVPGSSTETIDMSAYTPAAAQEFADQLNAQTSLDVVYNSVTNELELTNTAPGNSVLITTDVVATFGGSPAIPGSGGVTVASGGTITNSTITVDGNTTRGTVTGNTATNRIGVEATNLSGSGTATTSIAADDAGPSLTATTIGSATADNALANVQSFSSELDTNVAGTFGIVSDLEEYDTLNSTLSVSGNRMFATTQGNVVDNSIELTATNATATGAALSSLQADADGASVSAASQMDAYAPAAMEGSTLLLNDNRNEAVATVNSATNSIDVSATNMDSISGGDNASLLSSLTTSGFENVATADVVIANSQAATGPVVANAASSVRNQDDFVDDGQGTLVPFNTDGVLNSSATVNNNITLAQGSANRATNMLSLDGASALEVTGGVLNQQVSASSVTVNASMDAGLTLLNDNGNVIDSSSVEVSGNGTSAQASGNTSTNALSATALNLTASDGPASVNLNTGNIADGGASATYAVLNNQVNAGPVVASATATYTVRSTSGDGVVALNNAMVGVAGNVIEASAVGNSATNSVTLSALNYGASTAAIGNEQTNTANITASVSNGMIGSWNAGGVSASSVGLNGNSITSSAIGNRAVNSITRR